MSEVVVVARLTPRAGRMADLLELLGDLVPRVQAEEPGCLLYAAHRTQGEDDGSVVMLERFASAEAFKEHGASATMTEYGPRMLELLEGPVDLTLLDPLLIGSEAKGRVGG